MPDQRNSPTWPEIIAEAVDARLAEVHTSYVARVVSYDAGTQTGDVEPAILRGVRKRTGGEALEALPRVANVKIAQIRAGDFYVHAKVAPGDFVLVIVSEHDLNEWRRLGGTGVDPGDTRLHRLGASVALPLNIYPDVAAIVVADPDALSLGKSGGPSVTITDSAVKLGGTTGAKKVGRVGDQVKVTIPALSFGISAAPSAALVLNPDPVEVTGTITEGSDTVYAVD